MLPYSLINIRHILLHARYRMPIFEVCQKLFFLLTIVNNLSITDIASTLSCCNFGYCHGYCYQKKGDPFDGSI